MPRQYASFTAVGSPRELGRQHGEQAAESIRAFLDYLARSLELSSDALRARAMRFHGLFASRCPRLLEEVDGLAQGAGIGAADALALQIRSELGPIGDGACTTFAIGPDGTKSGRVLIGQTSDTPAEIEDFAYVLHLVPDDRPEVLIWTFGGMLGYHGLNSLGVAHFANALGGGPGWRFALPHYPLKRLLLEANDLAQAALLMQSVAVCSSGNYVLCDGTGEILDVELTPNGPHFPHDANEGFLVHTNHFLCTAHACAENAAKSLPDSFPRLARIRELVQSRFGSITVEEMQTVLSDHAGHPTGICRHPHAGAGDAILPNTGKTVAALIAEPQTGRLFVARGNPCEHPFIEYRLQAAR
jgi:isopenicillin-N N-acyltransferase like protein